jgi:hypothetical protein
MTYLYFIQGEQTRRIKVGISDKPLSRMRQLQAGSPDKLALLAVVKYGGYSARSRAESAEQQLHSEFKDSCVHGEWFNCTVRLLARIGTQC